jgi:hypothetical protein
MQAVVVVAVVLRTTYRYKRQALQTHKCTHHTIIYYLLYYYYLYYCYKTTTMILYII